MKKLPINKIIHGDCLEVMKDWPDNCVDLVLTDPPYGLDKKLSQGAGKLKNRPFRLQYENESWDKKIDLHKCFSISQWQCIWGSNYYALPPTRGILCWDKQQPWSNFSAAEIAWTNLDQPAKLFKKKSSEAGRLHPTQKPESLMSWCLSFFPEAKLICDPFCGSGTTCVVAKKLGLAYIGIDDHKEYCDIARKRIKQIDIGISVELQKQGFKGLLE